MPFGLAMRLWDTYLAEGSRLKGFLIYLAAAFLLSWSGPLRTMDFQVCIRLCMSLKVPALIGLLIYVAAALLLSWPGPPHLLDIQVPIALSTEHHSSDLQSNIPATARLGIAAAFLLS